jgi:pimeloyl-ACP methyl ester carboxylesterase
MGRQIRLQWLKPDGSGFRFFVVTMSAKAHRGEAIMTTKHLRIAAVIAALVQSGAGGLALAASPGSGVEIGTKFPDHFPVIQNFYLGKPVIGFGSEVGRVEHVPVIFLHGNNDTPFATACNPFGHIHDAAQFFLDHGYTPRELWGLGYQGDQCDLIAQPTNRSGPAHSTVANVPDLRAFVRAVLDYTGAKRVDIVGHSLGVTLAREWMREDHAWAKVRALVGIDGPNHGIISCSPNPANYFQLPASGGFTPDSAICREYGSDHTAFLEALNRHEAHPPTRYLVIRNVDTDFVYISKQDGFFPPVPAEDRDGNPHDFSQSALLDGVRHVDLTGQGQYDAILGTSHLGILNSPQAWSAALEFLRSVEDDD